MPSFNSVGVIGAGDDFEIQLDRYVAAFEVQLFEQPGDRQALVGAAFLAVDGDMHARAPVHQPMTMFDSITLRARSRSSPVSCM